MAPTFPGDEQPHSPAATSNRQHRQLRRRGHQPWRTDQRRRALLVNTSPVWQLVFGRRLRDEQRRELEFVPRLRQRHPRLHRRVGFDLPAPTKILERRHQISSRPRQIQQAKHALKLTVNKNDANRRHGRREPVSEEPSLLQQPLSALRRVAELQRPVRAAAPAPPSMPPSDSTMPATASTGAGASSGRATAFGLQWMAKAAAYRRITLPTSAIRPGTHAAAFQTSADSWPTAPRATTPSIHSSRPFPAPTYEITGAPGKRWVQCRAQPDQ